MSEFASLTRVQIERIVTPKSFRGTPYAVFNRTDGWLLCEVWFEDGEPKMQIRSNAPDLEIASAVQIAIQMATSWAIEMIHAGRNIKEEIASSVT